tara:strand:- start:2255 stop:2815 length:561 start_codon:yes stop_codon:yes gene_type:complete
MEHETMENQNPSYWTSVLIGGLIVGFITTIMSLGSQYMTIGSEPTGSSINLTQIIGILSCLVGAIGGVIATRHYAKEFDITFPIGKGALIGFLAGVVAVAFSSVIGVIWTYLIDPDLNQAFYDWQIANLEAQNMTDDQMEMAMGFIPKPGSTSALIWTVGIGLVVMGALNAISGLIGAKIFASEED